MCIYIYIYIYIYPYFNPLSLSLNLSSPKMLLEKYKPMGLFSGFYGISFFEDFIKSVKIAKTSPGKCLLH